jgi:tetratricopeptide (TPR) repeat protein
MCSFVLWRWRSLAKLALLALIGLAISVIGLYFWTHYHLRVARRAVDRGHNAVAISHLLRCRLIRPDDPEVLLLSARVARRGGAWAEAEALLDRYWRLHGDDDALVLERLLFQATRGEVESARPLLEARIDQDDPAAPAGSRRAARLAREALIAGLLHRFRLHEASVAIDRWLAREPESTLGLLSRGKLEELREQSGEALVTYRRLLDLDPQHDEARLRLTTILLRLGEGEEALAHLQHLRRRLPHHPEVLMQLGQALDLQGQTSEARAVLDECLRRHPDHAGTLAERGRLARREDGEQAEEYLRRAIELDPGNGRTRYQFYLTLNQNGKKAEAARELEALRRLEADVQRINELLRVQLQKTPDDAAVYHEVALIARRAGLTKESLRWLHSALQVDATHLPTHRALVTHYRETGNPILAARHRAIAQRLDREGR